jgi:hypothetical protein
MPDGTGVIDAGKIVGPEAGSGASLNQVSNREGLRIAGAEHGGVPPLPHAINNLVGPALHAAELLGGFALVVGFANLSLRQFRKAAGGNQNV